MGGRGGGALAARTAIDRFLDIAPAADQAGLRDAVATINEQVVREATNWGFERVGTTLLAALLGGPIVTVVHVGDSRAYRRSGEQFDLLTDDHNVRGELLAAGLDVAEYRERGVALHGLTSFIGLEHDVPRIDVLAVPMRVGDRLLLCTDGVHRQLGDDELRRGVSSGSCGDAAELLVEQADEAGGRDNATAMVLQVGVD
jgi:protein phosphatase